MSAMIARNRCVEGECVRYAQHRPVRPYAMSLARTWLRLFLIEIRRSPAIFAAILIAAMTGYMMWDSLLVGVVRWREVNNSAVEVPPLYASVIIGAFAAWRAGTIRQRRLLDQIRVTTFSPALRDLVGILSVAIWGIVGYLAPIAGFYVYASIEATWGGPDLIRPLIVIATIIAASALGWLVGTLVRHRIAPLAAVVLLLGLFLADDFTRSMRMTMIRTGPDMWRTQVSDGWWHHLVPNNVLTATYAAEIGFRVIGWVVGLAAVFWLIGVIARHRSRSTTLALGMVALLATGFAASVVAFEPGARYGRNQVAVDDVRCTTRLDDRITVCVHPANASLLDATADAVAPIVAPLAEIPDAPQLFIDGLGEDAYDHDGVPLYLSDLTTITDGELKRSLPGNVVRLEHDEIFLGPFASSAQYVVSEWLRTEAGIEGEPLGRDGMASFLYFLDRAKALDLTLDEYQRTHESKPKDQATIARQEVERTQYKRDLDNTIDHFIAMPDADRQQWLAEKWNALVAGELSMEDLP